MKRQLAVIRGLCIDVEDNGKLVEIIERVPSGKGWVSPDLFIFRKVPEEAFGVVSVGQPFCLIPSGRSMYQTFLARNVFPINDQPGNESWFTAAPKSLPATAKGDTIDARGEVSA